MNRPTASPLPGGEWATGTPLAAPLLGGVGVGSWSQSALNLARRLSMNRPVVATEACQAET